MKHRKDDECVRCEKKEDSVWKSFRQNATNLGILANAQESFRVLKCSRDRLLNVGKKF